MKVFTYIKENSCRVPGKNFRKIGDLELWKHLIYELSCFDLYIDTDSDVILNECKNDKKLSHVTAYKRKQKFIDIENDKGNKISPALLMVDNFLDNYADENEKIVVTHVTSPFLKKETIIEASEFLKDYNFVHSIYSIQDFAWIGDDFLPINFNPDIVQRTQDVDELHFSNGAFFMFKKQTFKKFKKRIGPKTHYFKLSPIEAIEIDNEKDIEFARVIHRGLSD